MQTQDLTITILALAIVAYAVFRQVTPQRVSRLRFVIFPLLAAYEAFQTLPHPVIPAIQIAECLVTVLVAVIAGAVQGLSARVFYRGNELYVQGGIRALAAWLGLFVCRIIIDVSFQGPHFLQSFSAVQWILWTAVAVTFGTRSLILFMRHPEIGAALAQGRGRGRVRADRADRGDGGRRRRANRWSR